MLTIAVSIFLMLGIVFAVSNWAGIFIVSRRYKREGIKRSVSLMPLVTQLFIFVAAIISSKIESSPFPGWLFWVIALADPALYAIAYYPIFLLRRKLMRR